MSFVLPNPTVPTNGQALDATPILANEVAIAQAIASFDGSQIQAGTVAASAIATTANPNTLLAATSFPFVDSGCVWTTISSLNGTMTNGTIYYNGIPVTVNSVGVHGFTASNDTYIDVDKNGNVTYQGVSNNSASPSLTANSVRVAVVVTSGSAITFINQGQTDTTLSGFAPVVSSTSLAVVDTLGNLIYPVDPDMRLLGYRQITGAVTLTTPTSATLLTGLTCPAIIPAGRKVKVTVDFGLNISNSGSNATSGGICLTSASDVNRLKQGNWNATLSGQGGTPGMLQYVDSAHSGLTTYVGYGRASTGNVTVNADALSPTFIRVELE